MVRQVRRSPRRLHSISPIASPGWASPKTGASPTSWRRAGARPREPNLSASLAEAGQQTARSVERAGGDDVVELYEAATAEARRLGVFGSPSFAVRGEVFWGDDRLDDAIAWFRHGSLKP
jgi:hypothetical protein